MQALRVVSGTIVGAVLLVISSGCKIESGARWPVLEEDPMSLNKEEIVSAQVVLKPAGGKPIDDPSKITSDNIQDFVPSADAIAKVKETFTSAGFKVGPVVGNNFSITASAGTFEKVFNIRLERHKSRGVEVVKNTGSPSYELPLDGLPKSVSTLIEAVTFTPPPDFGPTNFGP